MYTECNLSFDNLPLLIASFNIIDIILWVLTLSNGFCKFYKGHVAKPSESLGIQS